MSSQTAFLACAALGALATSAAAQPSATPADEPAPAMPVQPPPPPPPPQAPTAEFVSTGAMQWEVLVDRQPACATPCALAVPPGRWVSMRTLERRPVRVEVGMLGREPVVVSAKPLHGGAYATGITFTSLGGAAVVTGIVFTAVGCSSDDREGMCTAGLITGGVGVAVTIGSIWLMTRAVPRVRIHRRAEVAIAPTGVGVAGVF